MLRDDRGFTGAEKALIITFALAIIAVIGGLVSQGGQKAGGDAARVLAAGSGSLGGIGQGGAMGSSGEMPHAGDGVVARAVTTPPRPLAEGQDDTAYDGAFIGADGRAYPAGTPISQIPPVRPQSGEPNGTYIYVNGISNDKGQQYAAMQAIANTSGAQVIGIHNSTQGALTDIGQSAGDKFDIGKNPAVDALANTIYDAMQSGQPIHLVGHSQGALITSRALTQVQQRLRLEDGLSKAEAERRMGLIQVETFGGAAWSYPDGPRYDHYVNRLDPVPMGLGLGAPGANPGRGAQMHWFTSAVGGGVAVQNPFHWPPRSPVSVDLPDVHGLQDVYLPQRR